MSAIRSGPTPDYGPTGWREAEGAREAQSQWGEGARVGLAGQLAVWSRDQAVTHGRGLGGDSTSRRARTLSTTLGGETVWAGGRDREIRLLAWPELGSWGIPSADAGTARSSRRGRGLNSSRGCSRRIS